MKLKPLFSEIEYTLLQGSMEIEINQIQYDSRNIKENDIFVCITGLKADGHRFAKSAVESGARVLVCEHMPEGIGEDVTVIQVANARYALAMISVAYYGNPAKKMRLIGVTGTNGKTTTTYLIQTILNEIGRKVGVIGTIENRIGDRVLPTERTTPESKELQELFALMVEEGVTDVVMEVSSHSLDLDRVAGINFDIGIFTNLTQDHLDYHLTMENYMLAKAKLFERSTHSVINMDDEAGRRIAKLAKGEILEYAVDARAKLHAKNVRIHADGTDFDLEWNGLEYAVHLNTPGRFSVYNALGAIGACMIMDVPMERIIRGLGDNPGVSGRFQSIRSKEGHLAVVDYAHTPDGLENILKTAKEFAKGRILTVFGCGGDRDKTKRPIMGRIAGELSDYCIVTSDNPRTEDPMQIMNEVEAGVLETACPYTKIGDRKDAIFFAADMAKPGDVIIIAGKGHETYQIFADKTIHFDDSEQIRKAFGEDTL